MGDITNPFYPEVLEAFSYRLQKEGKQLLLFVVPPGGQADDVMPQVLQYQIDAVISILLRSFAVTFPGAMLAASPVSDFFFDVAMKLFFRSISVVEFILFTQIVD